MSTSRRQRLGLALSSCRDGHALSTRPQAKALAVVGRGQRGLALEQLAEARCIAIAAAFDHLVETQLRRLEQGLGAFDAQMLDVAQRTGAVVRAEMPQQAAL